MTFEKQNLVKIILMAGLCIYILFCTKEIGNFYQTGHAGFVNAELGLSHMNTINNGFIKTKFGSTNHKFIDDRSPETEEFYVRYPHLHNFLMAVFWKITGVSEISARLFAILLAFGSILVTYFTARELGFSPLRSALVFFALCNFPIFFHYAGLSSTEIFALFPLALSYFFYLKFLKQQKIRFLLFFLIAISFTCQLFWYGYLAAFIIFLDGLIAYFRRKEKVFIKVCLMLVLAVIINAAFFIVHTIWMVGSIDKVVDAYLWRSSFKIPETQQFTWFQFFFKNLLRGWLFNPAVILLALINISLIFIKKKLAILDSIKHRFYLILLVTPILFFLILRHLVHYHDFLVIYLASFLALVGIDLFMQITEKFASARKTNVFVFFLLGFMVVWAGIGLFIQPEEKMIDRDMDNYELYYVSKAVHNVSTPGDKILLILSRIQEPQVVFYIRRETHFNKVMEWVKDYVDSGEYAFCLVENIIQKRPLLKYLLDRYKCYKYYRYFLFDLRKPGKGLRIFKRQVEDTGLWFKYFVSPYHKPGKYKEIKDKRTIQNVLKQFESVQNFK
ncbi:MAG: glycosyltransferase family 39 protein [Candidatus Aminicenantes bacterium]|nr:glycosyltransferase family 39 protein [Candidatus Aminicenantes bacterium]